MNQSLPAASNAEPSKAPSGRRARHGLIEDWRDAVGILLLLLVAAFFGALTSRMLPETDDGMPGNDSDIAMRVATLESKVSGKLPADTAAMKEKVAKLETRLAKVEKNLSVIGVDASDPLTGSPLVEAAKRLEDAAKRLTVLETRTATAPEDIQAAKLAVESLTGTTTELTSRMAGVSERLEKLESSDLLTLARRASLASSIANLTRAAQGSSPFKTEYDVVAALLPNEPKLQAISAYATMGLPTVGTLISTFGSTADAAFDAEKRSRGKNWWSKMLSNFSSLISWRSTQEQNGSSIESRLARAEIRLKAGDLGAAVKELSAIKGAARKPIAPWLEQASARVKVEAILAELNAQAIDAITGSSSSDELVPQLPAP